MSGPSKRQQILELFRTRLQAIKSVDDFQTNLGDVVLLGELPQFGPDDPPMALAIAVPEDQVSPKQLEKVYLGLPVEIHIVTTTAGDDPWLAVEAGIADVKRAIELEDRFLGNLAVDRITRGVTRMRERESGTNVIGAVVPYFVPMTEVWGHPEQ